MPSLKRFRILCLHGQGVNAAIFAAQTVAFRSMLPSWYEFIFIDGGYTCNPAPGVEDFYSGPYLCWYNTPTTAKVTEAHGRISSVIENQGPFDAVMGFSQGAAVAASMILHHQIEYPMGPPIFRSAIFMGSPIPFSKNLGSGIDARTYFGLKATKPSRIGYPTTIPEYLITDAAYLQGDSKSGLYETYYQMFHPAVDNIRVQIPTAHIYGWKDPWYLHSKELVRLCSEDVTSVFEHDGGHEIPKSVSEEICDVIETAIVMAET